MLPEIELDVLHFLDRTALESLQMHSRYLRDVVNRHARRLPLRRIHNVEIIHAYVRIQLFNDVDDAMVGAHGEENLEMLFRRVNNAFVHRLALSFCSENLPFLYHLRANANDLQCQVKALRIENVDNAAESDYALVRFLFVHLKPRVYEMSTWAASVEEANVTLFANNAFGANMKHLVYGIFNSSSVPGCIIAALFGVDVVETCAIVTWVDPRQWIAKFVETFEMAERGTDVVQSVTLHHVRSFDIAPVRLDDDLFGRTRRRTDVPTPHSAIIKERYRYGHLYGYASTESPLASLFVVENARMAKKLNLFVWTVQEISRSARIALNYAFLLQVVDM